MVLSVRDLITTLHGMGFGVLFMLAFSGAIGVIYTTAAGGDVRSSSLTHKKMFRFYLISMAGLSWLTVLSGSYIVYPWYRAVPPAGTTDLSRYPQRLLMSSPLTAGWHDFGMEWKEHISWFTPIAMTMVAFVFIKYGPQLARHRHMRNAVLGFTAAAFMATFVSGVLGALLDARAPIGGGLEIVLTKHK
jgi:hypothetical protein